MKLCGFEVGLDRPFFLIAGPCVVESEQLQLDVAGRLKAAGLVISALTQREKLTEMIELPQDAHPWFVGVQFHPEFKSTPWDGHPLFISFIKAALAHHAAKAAASAAAGTAESAPPQKVAA